MSDFDADFLSPPVEYWPEIRWWLPEGSHTDEVLRAEVNHAHRLGFGGIELLAMDVPDIDHARFGWGSEEWLHDTEIVVTEAAKRGMAVSLTSGTNWSNANVPTIGPDDEAASQELDVVVERWGIGERRSGPIPTVDLNGLGVESHLPGNRSGVSKQRLVAVIAAREVESQEVDRLDLDSVRNLTEEVVDGTLSWSVPGDGRWRLFFYWQHGTGQSATPSASVNHTINYLSEAGACALIDYWDTVVLTPRLRTLLVQSGRAQIFMDSLEVTTHGAGGLLWSADLPSEFLSRRGYDLVPWLPFLTRDTPFMASSSRYHHEGTPSDADTIAKVRNDFHQTLTDLYAQRLLRPVSDYLHGIGLTLRAQISYGLPFEISQPGPEVDGIETESLEFLGQLDAYRLLSGAAHLLGKQYSAETGATTRNYVLPHRFYDQIIATQLVAGATRTVLHGWASTFGPESCTSWPGYEGMWPMFSERFGPRQPASEFYPHWARALARTQFVLRQGRPRVDVGILRRDYQVDNCMMLTLVRDHKRIPDEIAYGSMWMRDRSALWWRDLGMQDNGYTYEFLDPALLLRDEVGFAGGILQPSGPGYQALIVFQSELDVDAARQLLDWARAGLPVVLVDGATELKYLEGDLWTTHAECAIRTPGNDRGDLELAGIIASLTSLPAVRRVSPGQSVEALRSLGVEARAGFVHENRSVVTHLRRAGETYFLFVYHFLYEAAECTEVLIALPVAGAVRRLEPWSGNQSPVPVDIDARGRPVARLKLAPGETVLLAVRGGSEPATFAPVESKVVATIKRWHLIVESWTEGDRETVQEDRELGYVTKEARFRTQKSVIDAGEVELRPWRELAAIGPTVSGIGTYAGTVTLSRVPGLRYIIDLGSTAGGLAAISINGSPEQGVDTSAPRIDATDLLVDGANRVVVRVSSSLNNQLLARGYFEGVADVRGPMYGHPEW